ncbi:MAG: hypothetical protein Q7V62_07825 [Actinomycetota bacterium]|nr:hypothetical protein [Actinomycetota bacterium]
MRARQRVLACTDLLAHILSFTQIAPKRLVPSRGVDYIDAPEFEQDRVTGGIHMLLTCRAMYERMGAVLQRIPRWPLRYPHGLYTRITHADRRERNRIHWTSTRLVIWVWHDGVCVYTTEYWHDPDVHVALRQGPLLDWEDACILGWQWHGSSGSMPISASGCACGGWSNRSRRTIDRAPL